MPTYLGIDVGFSQAQGAAGRTLAIASNNLAIQPEGHEILRLDGQNGNVWCTQMNLSETVQWLTEQREEGLLTDATIVLDGPLAPKPPQVDRDVDQGCRPGVFNARCPAGQINAANGPEYVVATYLLAFAATEILWGPAYRMTPGNDPGVVDSAQLFETHPTIGMALSLPMIDDTGQLPTRAAPQMHDGTNIMCPAKSDWYWYEGAKDRVAAVLGVPQLEDPNTIQIDHMDRHEIIAGFYCLAVAMQIGDSANDETMAYTIGDPETGVYHLLGPNDPTWDAEINRVGLVPAVAQEQVGDDEADDDEGVQAVENACYCCMQGLQFIVPRQCPAPHCGHEFNHGWAGIDAHWRANHEDIMPYDDFWHGVCGNHGGPGP